MAGNWTRDKSLEIQHINHYINETSELNKM